MISQSRELIPTASGSCMSLQSSSDPLVLDKKTETLKPPPPPAVLFFILCVGHKGCVKAKTSHHISNEFAAF